MKKLILAILISSLIIPAAPAQETITSDIPPKKTWAVTMYLGWTFGGPCKQISDAMIANGFDDQKGSGWFGDSDTDYPHTDHYKPSWMISANYNLKSPFSIGITGGMTNLGCTQGYKVETWGHPLDVDYLVSNISTIFSYNSYDIVRIGIGPSIYFTEAWESSDHAEGIDVEYKHTKVGFLIDFGLRFPKKSLFFFELNCQYRYVGKAEIGPFNENPYRDELPKVEVTYNHVFIGGGFGVRF